MWGGYILIIKIIIKINILRGNVRERKTNYEQISQGLLALQLLWKQWSWYIILLRPKCIKVDRQLFNLQL